MNLNTPFSNNRPGKKWFYSFLSRHKILSQKHSEYVNRARGSVTEIKIKNWFKEVHEILGENASILEDPSRVFNMDETCFNLAPKGELIIGERGRNVYDEHTNSNKENVTTLFGTNALGKWAPPLTIFKYERIPAALVKSAPSGWGIGKSETGWMTSETFFEYMANMFLPFLNEENIIRPVIVFLDGHKSHLSLHLSKFCRENGMILVALYPNSTHILQPLDVAVFGPLKSRWKKIVKQWRIEKEKEISKIDVPTALSQIIYDKEMTSNIKSGFRTTGIYPYNSDNVDYFKIILRAVSDHDTLIDLNNIKCHLSYVETKIKKIDINLLDEFKRTRRGQYEWDGNTNSTMLFTLWSEIMDDVNNPEIEITTDITTPSSNQNLNQEMWLNKPSCSHAEENLTGETETPIIPSEHTTPESTIVVPAKRSLNSIFNDIIKWPVQPISKTSRKKEYTPSVITSDKWVEFHETKLNEKQEKERKKEEKKLVAFEKKKELEKKKIEKAQIKASKNIKQKIVSDTESSESEKSWNSKMDVSFDEESLAQPLSSNQIIPISNEQPNLNTGDYILIEFESVGKRKLKYKYVATIVNVISQNEFEVQCFEANDEENTEFVPIENDVSIVDILYKLPSPDLRLQNRHLISVFPGVVDVFEKCKY
uniref:DDE-1 domain-containing protein n=1 Tax=Sipha flava TaxID=143950 RepID=A0A2S2Q4Q0_9HEMI